MLLKMWKAVFLSEFTFMWKKLYICLTELSFVKSRLLSCQRIFSITLQRYAFTMIIDIYVFNQKLEIVSYKLFSSLLPLC